VSGPPTSQPAPDSIARNVGFSFAVGVTSAVFTGILLLFLVRELGPEEYGVFALAMSVGGLVTLPANLGIANATSRFMAESRHDRPTVHGVVSDAFRLKLLASAFFCIALAIAAEPIANAYDTPELTWPIRILSLAVFGQSMLQLYDQIFEAEGKLSVYLRIVAVESFLETTSSIALVLAGLGVSGAIAGRAGAYLFAAGFGLVLVVRTLGAKPKIGRGHGNVRRIVGYGSALLIIDGAFTLFSKIDVLLIGAIIDVTAVGEFEAAMRLAAMTTYAGAAVAAGVAPRVARGQEGPNTAAFDSSLKRLMAIQGIFIAPFLIWAGPLTDLTLGPGYEESADVLRAVTPFVFLLAISPVLARGVTYMGEARLRIPIAIGALLVNLAIDLALLSEIGIVAGAIGTDVAYALYVSAHLWLCKRLIGTQLRPLARTFAAVLLAIAAMSGVLFAFGTDDVSLPLLIVGGALGLIVYVGALLATRELTPADLAALRRRAVAMLPRRA
jgi:O-antigen/teichoic acid export membrane protein